MLRERNQADTAEHADVEILGKTGQTVIYVFPSGNAQVEWGEVSVEPSQTQSRPRPRLLSDATSSAPSTSPVTPSATAATVHLTQSNSSDDPATIVERLVQAGLLSAVQKDVIQYDQAATGMTLEEILIARGWFNEAAMADFFN